VRFEVEDSRFQRPDSQGGFKISDLKIPITFWYLGILESPWNLEVGIWNLFYILFLPKP